MLRKKTTTTYFDTLSLPTQHSTTAAIVILLLIFLKLSFLCRTHFGIRLVSDDENFTEKHSQNKRYFGIFFNLGTTFVNCTIPKYKSITSQKCHIEGNTRRKRDTSTYTKELERLFVLMQGDKPVIVAKDDHTRTKVSSGRPPGCHKALESYRNFKAKM